MAWQQPNVGGNGPAGGDGGGPPGTEYTLQGVMRFLQLEWHNHERARNAWDIERAEMKAKIAKQEGDFRSAKKLNEQLEKQIRMLEQVLKNERAKNKAGAADASPNAQEKDNKGKGNLRVDPNKGPQVKSHKSVDPEIELREQADLDRENQREKSRLYLQKCVEEVTYLLTNPPPAPQPSLQSLSNSGLYMNHTDGSVPLEDVYMQQRQRNQQPPGSGLNQTSNLSNHLPPLSQSTDMSHLSHPSHPSQQTQFMGRDGPGQHLQSQDPGLEQLPLSSQSQQQHQYTPLMDTPAENVIHSYDGYGQPMQMREEGSGAPRQIVTDDGDNWNFEEPQTALSDGRSQELGPARRPDTDIFPSANSIPAKSPPRMPPQSHRRRSSGSTSMSRRRSEGHEVRELSGPGSKNDPQSFKVRFALRGHLDVVRSVIFTGGGTPSEPEICTAGDDGTIKRWIIPASYVGPHGTSNDLDIQSYFTHRGHEGIVTSLAASSASAAFSTGGRVSGDGWIFSGGQDATVRVWERGRVDPKATLLGHKDAVWAVCVLPSTCGSVYGNNSTDYGGPERIILVSGSADGAIKIWAVSAPPQIVSPSSGSRRGVGGSRRHSVTSGSNFPSSPQPSVATATPFHYTLVRSIEREGVLSPTCISPLSVTGDNFVVSYTDASILIFDTKTGDEVIGMASTETYDGTIATAVNSIVASSLGMEDRNTLESGRMLTEDEIPVHGATGSSSEGGVEGIIISGHADQYIRFFDANSGQCTYSMLAHPSAISSLSLSKDGREAVSAGHDASIRFWNLEKRICTQEITSHRVMRGEGVCSVIWSQDGRLVVSAGGDGVVKVFAR